MPHAHVMSHKVLLTANTSVPLKHWDLCPCVDIKSCLISSLARLFSYCSIGFNPKIRSALINLQESNVFCDTEMNNLLIV